VSKIKGFLYENLYKIGRNKSLATLGKVIVESVGSNKMFLNQVKKSWLPGRKVCFEAMFSSSVTDEKITPVYYYPLVKPGP